MGYTVVLAAPKQIELREYEELPLETSQVRLRTLYSGISAGTELAFYRGTNPYLNKFWDANRRLFVEGTPTIALPLMNFGYEEVGEVIEIGNEVTRVHVGDRVWGTWGHKSTHIGTEEWAAQQILDATLDPLCGIFSFVGAICLNVVLDADIHVGELVAVFGQGVMGLTVTQLARLNGGTIIAVDGIPRRLALARECGASETIDFRTQDPAEQIKALTAQRGADVSIEMTGLYSALHSAIRATAYNARVVAAGFYQGEGKGLFLGEEFHHNRIQIICSQISGSSPRLSHLWNRLRLSQTTMALQAQGRIDLKRLISHIIPVEQAADAFRLLDEQGAEAVQVVLDFQTAHQASA